MGRLSRAASPGGRPIVLPAALAAAFLALHAAPLAGAPCAWGVDALVDLPAAARAAFFLAGAALLVPAVRRAVARAAARAGRRPIALGAGLAAGAVAGGWLLRSALPLLGDGFLHLGDLEQVGRLDVAFRDITWANEHAPLTNAILFALHRVGPWETPATTFRVLDAAAGALYVVVAMVAAWRLADRAAGRALISAFLLTAGYVQLFAGYVEMYALVVPLLLLYVAAGAEAAGARAADRGGGPPESGRTRVPWVPAGVLGVLIPLHLATATLLPSLVVVAAAAPGSTGRRAARAAAAVGACGAVAGLLFAAAGFDVAARLGEVRGGNLLPLLAEPTFRQAYRLLSPRHLTDFASQYLLAAPAAVMGIPLLRRAPGGRGGAFLVTAAAFPVLFGFVANPEVGAFRDWDVMSLAAVPLTLAVAVRLARGPRAADVAVLLAGAAALHTLAWVAGNADAAAAEARFVRLLRSCPASLHARAYGWESLARVYLGDGRTDAACTAFERAADFAPDNPRYWSSAATLHLEAGRADAAERCFARTVELDPTRAEAWQALGAIRYGRGDLEGALRFLAEALRLRPDLERAWFNRGLAELRLGRRREAAESFRSAVRADPALAPAWFNLGAVLRDLGDDAGAADAFRRFLGLGVGGAQAEEARRWLEARGSG